MKPSSKNRMTVSIILIVFLMVLSAIGYTIFGKPKDTRMLTVSTKIVKVDNIKQIELCKKYNYTYAIKVQENDKFYLKYYSYENNVPYDSKFDLTTDQYNKLVEGDEYWFDVDFSKAGDKTTGTTKKIYTENPVTM